MNWKIKKVKVSDLNENPSNPRKLTEKGLKDLEKSITKFGIAEPLVCNTDLMICGGHGRKKILERLNIAEVDCYLPEKKLTQKQFDELGIRLNKNIAGEFDFDILANEFEVDELIEWGFEEKELDLNLWNDIDESKLDEVPEIPKKAISMFGDLFEIDGKHRVYCGDSTKKEDVEKLMDGKKADMVFTDPPYNVNAQSRSKKNGLDKIKNDNMSDDLFESFCALFIKNLVMFSKEGSPHYYWHNYRCQYIFEQILLLNDLVIRNQIIWKKDIPSYSNNEYRQQHEVCFYCHNSNIKKPNYYGNKDSSVWEVASIQSAKSVGDNGETWFKGGSKTLNLHVTQKPVALSLKAVNGSSKSGDIILDSFLGSGSTLIACQQTNRICYGMELDPIYIDVILKRYKKLYPDAVFKCLNRKFDFDKLFKEI